MSSEDRDIFNDSEKFGQLAEKVEKLNKEKLSLEKRIEELENRMTGGSGSDQMTYNFIVEKQTTQMHWNKDRDSPGNSKAEGKDGILVSAQRQNRDKVPSSPDSVTDSTRGPVKQANDDSYPRAIFRENGEIVIVYPPRDTLTGSIKSVADIGEKDDRKYNMNQRSDNLEAGTRSAPPGQTTAVSESATDPFKTVVASKGKEGGEDYGKLQDEEKKSRRGDLTSEADSKSRTVDDSKSRMVDDSKTRTVDDSKTRTVDDSKTRTVDDSKSRTVDDNIADRSTQSREDGKDHYEIRVQRSADKDVYFSNTGGNTRMANDDAKSSSPENKDKDIEAIIPRVIVVTGFKQQTLSKDMVDEKPICGEHEQDNCQCYRIMRESDEWKANVTRLLELLVMNAYGNRCPKSLIKALMDPSTREQAIKELLNRTFATEPISQDNLARYNQRDSLTTLAAKNRMEKKDNSHLSIPKTFPQYPPYPKAFESRDSFSKQQNNYEQTAASRTVTGGPNSTSAGQGNKIDIVCPPGSRPVIHIPPSGSPAVTCDMPRSQNPRSNPCCSPNDPCERHR